VFFSFPIILGTVALYRKLVPIGPAVLPHYGSLIFLGLTLITVAAARSGSEGIELRSADRERLEPAALRKSRIHGFLLRMTGLWAGLLGCWMVVDALVLSTRLSDTTGPWRWFCILLPLPLLYLGFAVQGAGKNLLRGSRRHLTRVIQSPSHLGGERFVLYLPPGAAGAGRREGIPAVPLGVGAGRQPIRIAAPAPRHRPDGNRVAGGDLLHPGLETGARHPRREPVPPGGLPEPGDVRAQVPAAPGVRGCGGVRAAALGAGAARAPGRGPLSEQVSRETKHRPGRR